MATSGRGTVAPAAAAAPARLDEATRRLLRVPSLVAETAVRRGAGADRAEDVDAPARPGRRRVRRQHSRRPPSGQVRVSPQFGAAGGCDLAPGRAVTPAYRMSRRARLSLTLTVVASVVVLAAHALLADGPSGTTSVTVVAGDTLWSIAQRSAPDTEVWSVIDEISALNGLTGSDISAGQVLVVPVG
ncbi:MAG: LysM peptidoglycan-binding domain-containing protein [Nakamurella sp.]